MPQCITISAFDKNLKANASSTKANTFFTTSNQPPDLGKECNQLGNKANKVKGNASANPKPASPAVSCHAPPFNEPTNKEPKIGPVQEKDTMLKVSDIKKIPPMLSRPLLESALLATKPGRLILKNPKKEKANTRKIIKNIRFNQALVAMVLKICGFTLPAM